VEEGDEGVVDEEDGLDPMNQAEGGFCVVLLINLVN